MKLWVLVLTFGISCPLGAMSVPARMIAVLNLITLMAMVDMPAQGFGATAQNIPYGLQVAGEHFVPELV